jgi:hypothetical protein
MRDEERKGMRKTDARSPLFEGLRRISNDREFFLRKGDWEGYLLEHVF